MTAELLAAAIYLWLQSLGYPLNDESAELREERYQTIGHAVALSAGNPDAAASILTVWRGESEFALAVHRGEPTRWGSDNGRARCFGQVHMNRWFTREQWQSLAGTSLESTRACAAATLRMLNAFRRRCRNGWTGAYSGYASGNCRPNRYAARAKARVAIAGQLRALARKVEAER